MRKILSFTLSAILLASTVSCAGEKEPAEKKTYTAEKISVAAYKKEDLTLPEGAMQIYGCMPYNNGDNFLVIGTSTRTPEFWRTNSDLSESEIIEFEDFDIGVNYVLDTANDGTLYTFVTHADYGDLPPIKLYEYPEDYDEKLYDENAEYSFMLYSYSSDGKQLSAVEVTELPLEPSKSVSYKGMYTDGEIVIVEINGAYEMLDTDGSYLGELTSDSGDIDSIGHDSEGRLVCALAYEENETDKLRFCNIESDGTLTDYSNTVYDFSETVYQLMPSNSKYKLLVRTNSSIYGINAETDEIDYLLNVNVSGVVSNAVEAYFMTEDGEISVLWNSFKDFSVEYKKFVPRSEEEMANIPVITIGTYGGDMFLEEYVNNWNDAGNDFMVEVKVYTSEGRDDFDAVFDEMAQDAISGNLPDVLSLSGGYFGNINLREMGALCDLYEFMDNEEVYNRDYFIPNVLKCHEYNGKLWGLPNRIEIDLGRIGKTKYIGKAEDWSRSKAIDLLVDPPVELEEPDTKYNRFYGGSLGNYSINYNDFMNYDTAECDFDNEDFYRFLNWCNEAEVYTKEFVYDDPSEWTDEMHEQEYYEQQTRYINDKALIDHLWILNYINYIDELFGVFGGEKITFLDSPIMQGDTTLGIYAKSENKELAWEFIKSRITDDNYETKKGWFTSPFPVTETGLKMYLEQNRNNIGYSEEAGYPEELWDYKGLIYDFSLFDRTKYVKLGEITDEIAETVRGYIDSATLDEGGRYYTTSYNTIYDILEEETARFFNGECTAEECAKVIQQRMSLFLSEQFG